MAPDNDDEPPRLSDADLWRRVADSVRPLARERGRRAPRPPLAETEGPETQASRPQPPEPQVPQTEVSENGGDAEDTPDAPRHRGPQGARSLAPPFDDFWSLSSEDLGPEDLTHGAAAGLDKRTLGRLRKGMLPIEGTIDLHGLTQAEAHQALHQFIASSQQKGRRCVLVITGKGSRHGGVLRATVPHWLNLPANRSLVLAFTYATPAHGGDGALYILLRRRRPAP